MALHPALAATRFGVRRVLADGAPGDVVVVACSGGADSTALLEAAVFEGHKVGLKVLGVTVDHGMQPGSGDQAARTVKLMARLGVDETMTARVGVDARGVGPEAAARQARYEVLGAVAERTGARWVLLGHTRDDQAETVLLGLARGSGGRSIAGMRRSYDVFRRPLLDVTRLQTEAACAELGITPWQDPHNADPGYARVRVRRRVLPVLESELGPGVTAALARTADLLRPDMELLDQLADAALAEVSAAADGAGLAVASLAALPGPLRTRVLRAAAVAGGALAEEVTHEQVLELERLVTDWRGQRWIDLPGHVRGVRRDGLIRFER